MNEALRISHAPARRSLEELYGVAYFPAGTVTDLAASADNLYHYRCLIGPHAVHVEAGDCVYYVSDDRTTAHLRRGPCSIDSQHVATVIRGYMPEDRSSTIRQRTVLPYVNGCSTKQVFPPDRLGDPTLQLLDIPPFTSEQLHHIHSTARVVYVVSGHGTSIVGMSDDNVRHALTPGMVCILEPMCPHHFETGDEHLVVLPLHVFSSVPGLEQQHPMFNGTHRV